MKNDIQPINPINIKNWNENIFCNPGYSFFHTKEWVEVLSQTYGYNPVYFCLSDGNNISSIIPAMLIDSLLTGKRIVSMPFSDFSDPLVKDQDNSDELIKDLISYGQKKGVKYIEFRSTKKRYPFETKHFRTDFRHVLKLNRSEEELFRSFSENTRRNIKKANKKKLGFEILNSETGIKIFYKMMCVTRKKQGLPPQPLSFFINIFEKVIKYGLGDICFATKDGKYLAGAIYFKVRKKVLYKFGASYPNHYEFRGNQFVMWEAIKKYLSEGFDEFDFGRTETENEGLRRFKLGWNTQESNIYTTRYDPETKKFLPAYTKTTGIHNIFFKYSPVFVSRLLGRVLYKHIG